MDITSLIGLGIAVYAIISSKNKIKELKEDIEDAQNAADDAADNANEAYKLAADNHPETSRDLEIIPEMHLDINGGSSLSCLYLTFKNNNTKYQYKVGNFEGWAAKIFGYSANTWNPFKKETFTLQPGDVKTITMWRHTDPDFNDRVFLDTDGMKQRTYYRDEAKKRITAKQFDKQINRYTNGDKDLAVYIFKNTFNLGELDFTAYDGTGKGQDVMYNDLVGDLYLYAGVLENGYLNNYYNNSHYHYYSGAWSKLPDSGIGDNVVDERE